MRRRLNLRVVGANLEPTEQMKTSNAPVIQPNSTFNFLWFPRIKNLILTLMLVIAKSAMAIRTWCTNLRVFLLFGSIIPFVDAQQLYWIYPPTADRYGYFKDNILIESGSKQTLKWNTTRQITNVLALFQHTVDKPLFQITGKPSHTS